MLPAEKVFKRLGFKTTQEEMSAVVNGVPGAVERMLWRLKKRLDRGGDVGSANTSNYGSTDGMDNSADAPPTVRQPVVHHPEVHAAPRLNSQPRAPRSQVAPQPQGPQPVAPATHRNAAAVDERGGGGGAFDPHVLQKEVDTQILIEKEQNIVELRETIEILEVKIKKLEQLVRLKDSKIQTLTSKLSQYQ